MDRRAVRVLGVLLSVFILAEVNYPRLAPQSQLAVFALLGLVLVFGTVPLHPRLEGRRVGRIIDSALIVLTVATFGYLVVQFDPFFERWWIGGRELGNRAGSETGYDLAAGFAGLLLVLEAARRTIGWTLPLLSLSFLLYAAFGPAMPDWLFPHRGYSWSRIVSQTVLHSQGVFGIALRVMFTYVFLFVLFGTLLEQTGATAVIINGTRRLFRNSAGGPAKVAVIASGLMGSLSGSAVANTATTGTFTIPLMRSTGIPPTQAGGIEAAASSGGALVPPIMGAGAYMMLEIVDPPVTFLEIIQAALIPALLYYAALLLSVHFFARRVGAATERVESSEPLQRAPALVFLVAFVALIVFLLMGFTPFRAVSVSLVVILLAGALTRRTRVNGSGLVSAMEKAARSGIPLIAAAACVGLIIGVVTLTGVGSRLPAMLLPLAENHLLLALALLMVSTIVLGMGLPSAVCYLLMATLVGPVLGDLGLVPLAAHLFIFYFGMMSMVTPPVALAAYTASAIAESPVMRTAVSGFRFALVGFVLPYSFVLHPELLLIPGQDGGWGMVVWQVTTVVVGLVPLAAGIAGFFRAPLSLPVRLLLVGAALVLLLSKALWTQAGAVALAGTLLTINARRTGRASAANRVPKSDDGGA